MEPIIIKKYANRRLYNTETSSYITLEDLGILIRDGREFEVVDAKSGKDLTRAVLAQIIFEEENKGASMLPISFMKQLIGFYDNSMQSVLPYYLDMTMDIFKQNQTQIKEQVDKKLGDFSPFNHMQNMQRQNIEQMQHMMALFNPFFTGATKDEKDTQIENLSAQIAQLNDEIQKLKSK